MNGMLAYPTIFIVNINVSLNSMGLLVKSWSPMINPLVVLHTISIISSHYSSGP